MLCISMCVSPFELLCLWFLWLLYHWLWALWSFGMQTTWTLQISCHYSLTGGWSNGSANNSPWMHVNQNWQKSWAIHNKHRGCAVNNIRKGQITTTQRRRGTVASGDRTVEGIWGHKEIANIECAWHFEVPYACVGLDGIDTVAQNLLQKVR